MKTITSSATIPITAIHSIMLFELALSFVCVGWLDRVVCVVVVVVVLAELPLDCVGAELVVFWASTGAANAAQQAKLKASRHALIPLDD